MKKLLIILNSLFLASALVFTGCAAGSGDETSPTQQPSGEDTGKNPEQTPPAEDPDDVTPPADENPEQTPPSDDPIDADVICINAGEAVAAKDHGWLITGISLYEFNNKTVDVDFSAKMKVVNTGADVKLAWSINLDGYPEVASATFENGTSDWITVSGSKSDLTFGEWKQLYIGTYNVTASNLTIYLKDINLKVTDKADTTNTKTYTTISDKTGVTTVKESTVPAKTEPENTPPADDPDADVTCINGEAAVASANWLITGISLSDFNNKTVDIDFSAKMKVTNTGSDVNLGWSVNVTGYPSIASATFENGTSDWVTVSGKKTGLELGSGNMLYMGTYGVTASDLTLYIKDIKVVVTDGTTENTYTAVTTTAGVTTIKGSEVPAKTEPVPETPIEGVSWLDNSIPSLKETYADVFDSFGLACEYDSWAGVKELSVKSVRDGLAKHVDSISMGNEFKPDGFFGYQWSGNGKTMIDFTASNGLTIKVPKELQFDTQDKCLAACKEAGLKMRGHVLAWHAQTPDNFFAEDYVAAYDDNELKNTITNRVSKEVMQARMEWYFSTILKHVDEWEKENKYRAIWAWDVFNETVADDADETNWVRGSTESTKNRPPAAAAVNPGPCGSRWYQCYEDTDFIVDAFRFANAYAPSDVKLCYNDYNEYMTNKTNGILELIKLVKAGSEETVNGKLVKPRIDVMGLQSHVGVSWPGVTGYENALKQFLELVDCHVTELDISCTTVSESKKCWAEYFTMLQKYGNNYSGSHKITNITIWGINNKSSWIYKDDVIYPVLFDDFKTTDAFWAVINAHK